MEIAILLPSWITHRCWVPGSLSVAKVHSRSHPRTLTFLPVRYLSCPVTSPTLGSVTGLSNFNRSFHSAGHPLGLPVLSARPLSLSNFPSRPSPHQAPRTRQERGSPDTQGFFLIYQAHSSPGHSSIHPPQACGNQNHTQRMSLRGACTYLPRTLLVPGDA